LSDVDAVCSGKISPYSAIQQKLCAYRIKPALNKNGGGQFMTIAVAHLWEFISRCVAD
jgi:hypothetical protein